MRGTLTPVTAAPAGGGTVTPNCALGLIYVITMPAGNITIGTPTNPGPGDVLRFVFIQDATGGRTITWPASTTFRKAADGAGTASQRGSCQFIYDGASWNQHGGALTYFT